MKLHHYMAIVGVVVLLVVILTSAARKDLPDVRDPSSATPPQGDTSPGVLDELACTQAGGTWNACGSACRTTPDVPCIELCVPYCECTTDAQCPTGYACGNVVEEVGVCL